MDVLRVVVVTPEGDRLEVSCPPEAVTLGRSGQADICIPSPEVSALHLGIRREADAGLVVTDLGSANGTVVNGLGIASGASCRTQAPALIRLGPITVEVSLVGDASLSASTSFDAASLAARMGALKAIAEAKREVRSTAAPPVGAGADGRIDAPDAGLRVAEVRAYLVLAAVAVGTAIGIAVWLLLGS